MAEDKNIKVMRWVTMIRLVDFDITESNQQNVEHKEPYIQQN